MISTRNSFSRLRKWTVILSLVKMVAFAFTPPISSRSHFESPFSFSRHTVMCWIKWRATLLFSCSLNFCWKLTPFRSIYFLKSRKLSLKKYDLSISPNEEWSKISENKLFYFIHPEFNFMTMRNSCCRNQQQMSVLGNPLVTLMICWDQFDDCLA